MQFDLFNHSQSVAWRNDVIHAVARADAVAARLAWDSLHQNCPQDDGLGPLWVLVTAVATDSAVPFRSHEALADARRVLDQEIAPAARAAGLPYQPLQADDHAAPLWLRAGNWQAAADAVTGIASWRRIPAPLAWMLLARLQLQGLPANWPLVAELAWLAPDRLDGVARAVAEPLLQALLRQFVQGFDGGDERSDLAWFPAWVLIEQPALAAALTQAQPSQHSAPEQAMRLLLGLLGLERQGRQRELIEHRKRLRDLQASLYNRYMARR